MRSWSDSSGPEEATEEPRFDALDELMGGIADQARAKRERGERLSAFERFELGHADADHDDGLRGPEAEAKFDALKQDLTDFHRVQRPRRPKLKCAGTISCLLVNRGPRPRARRSTRRRAAHRSSGSRGDPGDGDGEHDPADLSAPRRRRGTGGGW